MVWLHVVCIWIGIHNNNNKNNIKKNKNKNNNKRYHANKWILEDRRVPIFQRLRYFDYFDCVVSSVACFAGEHRTIYLMLFNAPPTTGYEEFCIGNPWGKGDSGVQTYAGRANWKCTFVTKDWFNRRWIIFFHFNTFLDLCCQ